MQKLSVIDYQNNRYEHFYFINWTVIRGYALLPEPLTVGGNKRPYFVQQPQNEYTNHPLQDKPGEYLQDITGEYLQELARMEWDKVLETLLLTEDNCNYDYDDEELIRIYKIARRYHLLPVEGG